MTYSPSAISAAATDIYKFEPDARAKAIVSALGSKSLVLVGMMGAGKTSVGKRLAARLGLDFLDADAEIESAHRMTIPEIFAKHGEAYFREGERKVVARLLESGLAAARLFMPPHAAVSSRTPFLSG